MPHTPVAQKSASQRSRPSLAGYVPHTVGTLALMLMVLPASTALAGGFEFGVNGSRATARGGAFTVRADDLTAIDHNPGGLSRLHGNHLTLSHNTVHARMSFTRAASVVPQEEFNKPGSPDPLKTVTNQAPWFALGGMFVAASDFGMRDFTFAVGAYGPSAVGKQKYDVRGGSRWMLTEIEAIIAYYSAAVAYGKDNWGVGVTLQLAHQMSTKMSLVVDGTTGGQQSPYYSTADVLATIELSAPPAFTAIFGAWWRPIDAIEVAVSGRVMPANMEATGDITLANTPGGSQFGPKQLEVENSAARMNLVIPPTAKAGIRYRHLDGKREVFDVELNVVYEAWSMLKQFDVELDGTIKLFAAAEAPDIVIAKNWKDTLAIRLGSTAHVTETLAVSFGGFYETGAVPVNYTHLDFPSFDRIGLGVGVQGRVKGVDLSLAYGHIMQEKREVDERYGQVFQQRPIAECPGACDGFDAVPANAGTFETGFSTLSLTASIAF